MQVYFVSGVVDHIFDIVVYILDIAEYVFDVVENKIHLHLNAS